MRARFGCEDGRQPASHALRSSRQWYVSCAAVWWSSRVSLALCAVVRCFSTFASAVASVSLRACPPRRAQPVGGRETGHAAGAGRTRSTSCSSPLACHSGSGHGEEQASWAERQTTGGRTAREMAEAKDAQRTHTAKAALLAGKPPPVLRRSSWPLQNQHQHTYVNDSRQNA